MKNIEQVKNQLFIGVLTAIAVVVNASQEFEHGLGDFIFPSFTSQMTQQPTAVIQPQLVVAQPDTATPAIVEGQPAETAGNLADTSEPKTEMMETEYYPLFSNPNQKLIRPRAAAVKQNMLPLDAPTTNIIIQPVGNSYANEQSNSAGERVSDIVPDGTE